MQGWLHAVPEKKKETRFADYVNRNKQNPPMPEVEHAEHLLEYLQEFGPAYYGGGNVAPLPFFEIKAWSDSTCTPISPWECITLRKMSERYVRGHNDGGKLKSAPPWAPTTGFDKEAIATGMRGLLGKINQKRQKG